MVAGSQLLVPLGFSVHRPFAKLTAKVVEVSGLKDRPRGFLGMFAISLRNPYQLKMLTRERARTGMHGCPAHR